MIYKNSVIRIFFTILITLFSINSVNAQSALKQFFKLPRPEKCWVITHPFKAKRALNISLEARFKADSIAKTTILDGDKNGGQVDAFRHSYWQARLTQTIGKRASYRLGKAHEKANYIYYKRNKYEDGSIPDKISSDMDLFNNNIGISTTSENKHLSKTEIELLLISRIKKGELRIISKNKNGNFLSCDGVVIEKESLIGKWENNKCLINSSK